MTELQEKVFNKAKENLQQYPWFSGICCDDMPSDDEIKENFDSAVTTIEMNTAYWDAPNFFDLTQDWE